MDSESFLRTYQKELKKKIVKEDDDECKTTATQELLAKVNGRSKSLNSQQ
jgi:hypothetical protein